MKLRLGIIIATVMFLLILGNFTSAGEYRLGPGDLLSISIWGQVSQNYNVTVGADGSFELPMIGKVIAVDKTISELAEELEHLFASYIKEPNVIINVTKPRSIRVQIVGNVKVPGLYTGTAETTLSQVLAMAGGITLRGDAGAVKVQRTTGDVITVDLNPLLTGNGGDDFDLQNGDIIVVPIGIINVAVIGEVNNPGIYELPQDARLMDAIMAGGGTTRQGITRSITIYSSDELMADQARPKVEVLFKGGLQENPDLKQGYVVYVPRNIIWDIGLVVSIISALQGVKSLLGL